jgi:hypothetical protein
MGSGGVRVESLGPGGHRGDEEDWSLESRAGEGGVVRESATWTIEVVVIWGQRP